MKRPLEQTSEVEQEDNNTTSQQSEQQQQTKVTQPASKTDHDGESLVLLAPQPQAQDVDTARNNEQQGDENIDNYDEMNSTKLDPYNTVISQTHPLGIQPEGNRLFSDLPSIREPGLGLMASFDDEFICDNILSFFDESTLLTFQQCSKAAYAIVNGFDVEIWKERVVALSKGDFIYQWRWKNTYFIEHQLRHNTPLDLATIPQKYINMYNKYPTDDELMAFVEQETALYEQEQQVKQQEQGYVPTHPNPLQYSKTYPPQLLDIYPTYESSLPRIQCKGYFSDALFQPWLTIATFYANEHKWRNEHNISRVSIKDLTVEDFNEKYSLPGKPVVITNVTDEWPAVKDQEWSIDKLLTPPYTNLKTKYICGIADLTLDKYLLYAARCNDDDTPIYLFDKQFGERNPYITKQYQYPEHFSEDYFQLLRKVTPPPFRWWLIGPKRSGSTFHVDPILTQAQNMMVHGLKKWILYPPHITPPGITASHDRLQVTAPFNVTEWFITYYPQSQKAGKFKNKVENIEKFSTADLQYDPVTDYPRQCDTFEQYRPVEILQRPGETVFIPATWWHMVINLDFGVAVTQNQVNQGNFIQCERFLQKIEQPEMRQDLLDAVEAKYPGMHKRCEEKSQERAIQLQKYQLEIKQREANGVEIKPTAAVKRELFQIFNAPSKCNNNNANNQEEQQNVEEESFSFGFD